MATNKIQTGLRLTEDIYEKAKFLAAKDQRSLNNFIEYVVQCYIDNYESNNGSISLPDEE